MANKITGSITTDSIVIGRIGNSGKVKGGTDRAEIELIPEYEGPYEVTPDRQEHVLETDGLKMADDVVVHAIPSGYIIPAGSQTVTENGEYDVTNLAELVVNVSGSSKTTQVVQGTTRTNASNMTAIGSELTVSKTGTYDIYYSCFRTNTSSSYTWATRLYINGAAYGTAENTTWTNNQQNTHLSNISLTAGDKLSVYGRNTRGTSYYVCAPTLAIVEA